MRESLFRERLRFLATAKYPVISLEEALEGLKSGDLPHAATVITIDDGWYGMYAKGLPILIRVTSRSYHTIQKCHPCWKIPR